jgi:hypothetical protein
MLASSVLGNNVYPRTRARAVASEGVENLILQLQEIGEAMPHGSDAGPDPDPEVNELWRDSTLELERGLDVVELPLDTALPELPELPEPPEHPKLPERQRRFRPAAPRRGSPDPPRRCKCGSCPFAWPRTGPRRRARSPGPGFRRRARQ